MNMEDIIDHGTSALATQFNSPAGHNATYRIPAEIFADIFLLWVAEENERHHWPFDHQIIFAHSPFALAQVCSTWRKIVFDTARLWTSVNVSVSPDTKITDEWVEMFVAYLGRSKVFPLEVRLKARRGERAQEELGRLVDALMSHVGRIRSLETQSACEVLQDFPNGERGEGWPLLEKLSITTWRPSGRMTPAIEHPQPCRVFSEAPKLREVELIAVGDGGSRLLRDLSLTLPWAQITTLTTENVFRTAPLIRQIVLQCPLLEHCSLGTVLLWRQDTTVFDLPQSAFPHLKTLSVKLQHGTQEATEGAARFFQPFIMPALQQLDIKAQGAPEASETPAYINFIYSQSCPTFP